MTINVQNFNSILLTHIDDNGDIAMVMIMISFFASCLAWQATPFITAVVESDSCN